MLKYLELIPSLFAIVFAIIWSRVTCFTEFRRFLLGLIQCSWVLLDGTKFYLVLLGFAGSYRVLPSFSGSPFELARLGRREKAANGK